MRKWADIEFFLDLEVVDPWVLGDKEPNLLAPEGKGPAALKRLRIELFHGRLPWPSR